MRLRVGVVGLGAAWDNRYRPALRSLVDRFEVRAICAGVSHLAEQAARGFGATTVDGFRTLAARDDIDAILVLAADWYGALPILAACDAGKAVYCATVLDLDPQRAVEIKKRVDQSGVAFMAEFLRRRAPATVRLKELIATRLGPPQLLFCHQRKSQRASNSQLLSWDGDNQDSRDLMELIDWCCYVVGMPPSSVIGVEHRLAPQASQLDYDMVSLDFSGGRETGRGAVAQISCGRYLRETWSEAVGFRPPAALQVCCENGVAFIDLPATLVWFDEAGRHLETLEDERPLGEQLLTQFHRSVTSLVRRTSDLEEVYRSIEICLGARRSVASGQRIFLDFAP